MRSTLAMLLVLAACGGDADEPNMYIECGETARAVERITGSSPLDDDNTWVRECLLGGLGYSDCMRAAGSTVELAGCADKYLSDANPRAVWIRAVWRSYRDVGAYWRDRERSPYGP